MLFQLMTACIIPKLLYNIIKCVRITNMQFSSYIFVFIQTIEFCLIQLIAGRCSDSEVNCDLFQYSSAPSLGFEFVSMDSCWSTLLQIT